MKNSAPPEGSPDAGQGLPLARKSRRAGAPCLERRPANETLKIG